MMNYSKFILLMSFPIILTACSQNDELEVLQTSTEQPLLISAKITQDKALEIANYVLEKPLSTRITSSKSPKIDYDSYYFNDPSQIVDLYLHFDWGWGTFQMATLQAICF